jgi:hypothetical protein
MSVGGVVVDVYEKDDMLFVTTRDTACGDRMQVRLEKGHDVLFGDTLWWHSQTAYWTPKDGSLSDIPIKKIANSVGLPRPKIERR